MCGIVGYIAKPLHEKPGQWELDRAALRGRWFKQALLFDTVRGEHSTGVMGRDLEGEPTYRWMKNAVPGYEFVTDEDFLKDYVNRAEYYDVMVGHNRAATIGDVSTENAHPFEHGDIILVHNGTLSDTGPLEAQHKNIEVDSSLIAFNLSMVEPGEAGKVLSQLDGAYTLVWLDSRDDSINIVRNSRRPLHMAATYNEDCLFFMSEGRMLEWTLDRLKINTGGVRSLAPLHWLKFKDGIKSEPEVRKVTPFVRPAREYSGWGYGGTVTTTKTTRREVVDYTARRSAGPTVTSKADEIAVGKSLDRVPVPEVFRDIMSWFDLKIESRLLFEPREWESYKAGRHTTAKTLPLGRYHGDVYVPFLDNYVDCVVHNLGHNLEQYIDNEWTVRPVCITWAGDSDMTVHALLVATSVTPECEVPTDEVDEPNTVLGQREDEDWSTDDPLLPDLEEYPGPFGDCSKDQMEHYLRNGCSMCTGPIDVMDYDDIEWVGEQRDQPICGRCVEDWTREYGE